MDTRLESYFHTAILACGRPRNVATIDNNRELRQLLMKYGNFRTIYNELKIEPPTSKIKVALSKVQRFLGYARLDLNISTINDSNFPEQLRVNEDCAPAIYYRGNLDLLKRDCIAVVGTRNPLSSQELADSKKVLDDLVKKNYVIVSGLASGCDTQGHQAGLQTGTVAVLGTPINKYYPKENEQLQEKIAREHLLISQFPVGIENFLYFATEQPHNFKKRNQTTVVLANKGVVVLKTADKGGTQNAINESQYFQRPLYALRANFTPENTWTQQFQWTEYAGGLVRQVK